MRIAGAIFAGLMFGAMIHIIVILILPRLTETDSLTRLQRQVALEQVLVLEVPASGEDNPFGLDPEMAYAACRFDLSRGPAVVSGLLPGDFWSVAAFDDQNRPFYGTTNRGGVGQTLQLGVFNPTQMRQVATQELEITDGLLVAESPSQLTYVIVRIAIPFPSFRARYEEALAQIECGHVAA